PSCDDGNPCTADSCSPATNACVHDPAAMNGLPCSIDFCIVGQTCQSGTCGGSGTPRNCDDGLPCTTEFCNEALQACETTCTTAPCWVAPLGSGGGTATAPVSDVLLHTGPSSTFVAQGTKLFAVRNTTDATGNAGTVKWTWNEPNNATINNFPSPVPLSNGTGEYIFVAGQDGRIYKIRADDGASMSSADLRRTSCATDSILATPAVQLYSFSSPDFRNDMDTNPGHMGDDLVFVGTRTGCG